MEKIKSIISKMNEIRKSIRSKANNAESAELEDERNLKESGNPSIAAKIKRISSQRKKLIIGFLSSLTLFVAICVAMKKTKDTRNIKELTKCVSAMKKSSFEYSNTIKYSRSVVNSKFSGNTNSEFLKSGSYVSKFPTIKTMPGLAPYKKEYKQNFKIEFNKNKKNLNYIPGLSPNKLPPNKLSSNKLSTNKLSANNPMSKLASSAKGMSYYKFRGWGNTKGLSNLSEYNKNSTDRLSKFNHWLKPNKKKAKSVNIKNDKQEEIASLMEKTVNEANKVLKNVISNDNAKSVKSIETKSKFSMAPKIITSEKITKQQSVTSDVIDGLIDKAETIRGKLKEGFVVFQSDYNKSMYENDPVKQEKLLLELIKNMKSQTPETRKAIKEIEKIKQKNPDEFRTMYHAYNSLVSSANKFKGKDQERKFNNFLSELKKHIKNELEKKAKDKESWDKFTKGKTNGASGFNEFLKHNSLSKEAKARRSEYERNRREMLRQEAKRSSFEEYER